MLQKSNTHQSHATNPLHWYVLFVKNKQEFKVETYINALANPHITAFAPSRIEIKQWSDRKKKVKVPLLPSIVLINSDDVHRDKAFFIPYTQKYLFQEGKPAVVKEHEITQLKAITKNKQIVSHEVEKLQVGQPINLKEFGFKEASGIIEKISTNMCWIVFETLGYRLKVSTK